MSRRGRPSSDYYEEDIIYAERDRPRQGGRRDRIVEEDIGPRRRPRPPQLVRDIDERIRVRDRSAPDFMRESFLPPLDDGILVPRRRDRDRDREELEFQTRQALREGERETEELYIRRGSPALEERHRRRTHRDEVVIRDEDRGRGPIDVEEISLLKRERSLPPREEIDRDEIRIRRRDRSLPPRDEEIVIDEGRRRRRSSDRALEREDVVMRRRDRSPPREDLEREEIKIRRRSSPARPEERDEVIIRHRDRSPPREKYDRDEIRVRRRGHSSPRRNEERDEVIIRHGDKSAPPREEDREEVIIRHRDRSPPRREAYDRDEVRVHRRNRSVPPRDEERDEVIVRHRSAHPREDDDREEVIVRKDRGGRRRRSNEDREEIRIRHSSRERSRDREREYRRRSPPRARSRADEKDELIIRRGERDERRGRGDVDREEIIIRKEERSPLPEPLPEPPVVRPPPIVQEIITHHRHIDHGFETAPTPRRQSPEARPKSGSVDEIQIRQRGERDGRAYEEDIVIDHREKESSGPRDEVIIKTKSDSREREREIVIREGENEVESGADGRDGRRYRGIPDKRDRLWTEITKDLVVREAIERVGLEYDESEDFYYVFEKLRYDDIAMLVDLSDDIRRARRERIHEIRRERETLPPLPVLPGPPPPPPPIAPRAPPLMLERGPALEPYPWEDRVREREREVIIEEGRRPARRYREV